MLKNPLTVLLMIGLAMGLSTTPLIAPLAETNAGLKVRQTKQDFESALFELNNAIVNRGLVIDYTGHVSKMLDRTSNVTGSRSPYTDAQYLNFCSATLSQAAMRADPNNLAVCPYVVFIYELKTQPGVTHVGYRRPIASKKAESRKAIADIETLLDGILADAVK